MLTPGWKINPTIQKWTGLGRARAQTQRPWSSVNAYETWSHMRGVGVGATSWLRFD